MKGRRSTARTRPAKPGECQACIDVGLSPSIAVACTLHSTLAIRELRAEIAVLQDTASASSRLHLAIAERLGSVPSADGKMELQSVIDATERLDRVEKLLQHAALVAQWDDTGALALEAELFKRRRR